MNPLLEAKYQDRALRDLMPVVDWLVKAELADANGITVTGIGSVRRAKEFLRTLANSPAYQAYTTWLNEKVNAK